MPAQLSSPPSSGVCGADVTRLVDSLTTALVLTFVPHSFFSVTFPLDLTKTRLQVQGEAAAHRSGGAAGQTVPYRGMLRTMAGIVQEEGLQKLWQGATPAVYRHIGDYLAQDGTSLDPAFCGQEPFGAGLPYHLGLQICLHRLLSLPCSPALNIWDAGSVLSLPSLACSFMASLWLLGKQNIIFLLFLQEDLQCKQTKLRVLRTINNFYLREVGMGLDKKR